MKNKVITGIVLVALIIGGVVYFSQSRQDSNSSSGGNNSLIEYSDSNEDCLVKGNISSSGERIYHVEGGQFYSQTIVDSSKGERWFCTEAEARAAGWRKSLR